MATRKRPAAASPKTRKVTRSPAKPADPVRNFAVAAAVLAADTRCTNVNVLDVSGLSPVTDYFIIATGTSPRQMRSVAEDIEELAEKHGLKVLTRNGYEGESWILIDLVDVIVHIFNAPSREYYDLDNLWGDARKIDWRGKSGQAKTG